MEAGAYDMVKEVEPMADYRVRVLFRNGRRAVFDCTPYLADSFWAPLKDVAYFNRVRVDGGVLTWSDLIDVAPEEVWANSVDVAPESVWEDSRKTPCGGAGEFD